HNAAETFRQDVLIMEMVDARYAGVAFTERDFEDDLINYTSGTADKLVSGMVEGASFLLPKRDQLAISNDQLTINESTAHIPHLTSYSPYPTSHIPYPTALRLQTLLKAIRRTFSPGDWDIEWADDGRRCWLVQLRPITRPPRRNEAFTTANFKEIMPELPSRFTASLIASCAEGLFAYYRRFDSSLPARREIIELCCGRPYFNISLLTEMLRLWGLPTRLVTGNIGGEAEREYGFNLLRFLSKTSVLLRLGLAQLRSVGSARRTIDAILARTDRPGSTFSEAIELLRWLFTSLVTEMFSLTAAMSGPLLLLRQAGVLAEHNARQRTIATQMFTDQQPLRQFAAQNDELRAALVAGHMPEELDFQQLWRAYLAKHGHRGVYESDIALPRLHEAPEALLSSLVQPMPPRQPPPPRTLLGWLTLPLWWQAGRVMRARELLRYNAMIGFDRVRQAMLALADGAVVNGSLPDRDSLWLLDIDEVRQLERGWQPDTAFFDRRRQEIEALKAYDLPDLIHRFDDLEQYRAGAAGHTSDDRFSGLSLTAGQVTGRAWVLTAPDTNLPSGFIPEQTILVARSVDAGWIPTFSCVAGVVVEIGGDLSHGSIILREIGLPAITNVRGITRQIQTGDELVLRAGVGVVELCSGQVDVEQ
ncbi:MAG TPA: PEP-utilizing enzyme, partial [Anaerolineae bacterium]